MDKRETCLQVVLINPLIPPNTGNIARLCAANDIELHLVGDIGFSLDDKHLKRAGLDYWDHVKLYRHDTFDSFIQDHLLRRGEAPRCFFFTKKADKSFFDQQFKEGDVLVFGPEDKGFSDDFLADRRHDSLRIPMSTGNVRSLNLSSAVAVAVYEALRQIKR